MNDYAYGLSKYRVTLSTSGVLPQMYKLFNEVDPAWVLSLHAPTDALRDTLVPLNKKYNLSKLFEFCQTYVKTKKRPITFAYTMIKNINDHDHDATALANLLKKYGLNGKVNLIPYNPIAHIDYETSDEKRILHFRALLMNHGIITTIRSTRGNDVTAACGQLSGAFLDRTHRSRKRTIPDKKES